TNSSDAIARPTRSRHPSFPPSHAIACPTRSRLPHFHPNHATTCPTRPRGFENITPPATRTLSVAQPPLHPQPSSPSLFFFPQPPPASHHATTPTPPPPRRRRRTIPSPSLFFLLPLSSLFHHSHLREHRPATAGHPTAPPSPPPTPFSQQQPPPSLPLSSSSLTNPNTSLRHCPLSRHRDAVHHHCAGRRRSHLLPCSTPSAYQVPQYATLSIRSSLF
ncbi:hypothetical protein S245_048591, partial [Arachis hypogaea]